MAQSVLARLDPSQIYYDPYPHVISHEVLDPAYYAELEAAFPTTETIAGSGPLPNNKLYSRSALDVISDKTIPEIWRDFFAYHTSQAFLEDKLRFWAKAIADEYPDIEKRFGKRLADISSAVRHRGRDATPENLEADVMLDCQFGVNSPVTTPTSVRVPHVDNPFKLFAGLLYFRRSDDQSTGGDLNLYRLKVERYYQDRKLNVPDRFIDAFDQVQYRPNMLVMWLNTPRSLHGVTPRSVTDVPRRHVNFIGECYQLSTHGFFPIKRSLWRRTLETFKHTVGLR